MERWDRAAREHRFSRSSYFAAAYAAALRAIHQQDDIAMLMIVAKRGQPRPRLRLHHRINSNCVRVRFDGRRTVTSSGRVQRDVDELMAAQDVPFRRRRRPGRSDISGEVVASMPAFAYQDNVVLPLELPGCRTEEIVEPYAREVITGSRRSPPRDRHALLRVTIRTD